MFKKLLLFLLSATFVMMLNGAVKIDQSSPEAVVKTFFAASVANDDEVIWQLLPPAVRMKAINALGSEEAARKYFASAPLSAGEAAEIKKYLNDDEFITAMAAAWEKNLEQVAGKWYLYPPRDEADIDRSTPEKVMELMVNAVVDADNDTYWELLSPVDQIMLVENTGSIDEAKRHVGELLKLVSREEMEKFRKQKDDPDFIAALAKESKKSELLVNIDGQWFALMKKDQYKKFPDQKAALKTFMTGMVNGNIDDCWKTLSPYTRLALVAEAGDVKSAKSDLQKLLRESLEELKKAVPDLQKITSDEFIDNMLKYKKVLIQICGSWYVTGPGEE